MRNTFPVARSTRGDPMPCRLAAALAAMAMTAATLAALVLLPAELSPAAHEAVQGIAAGAGAIAGIRASRAWAADAPKDRRARTTTPVGR
jgi:hypothetical protein